MDAVALSPVPPIPAWPHLTPGVIDDAADFHFSMGQCGALAVAVARRHGWDLLVQHSGGTDGGEGDEELDVVHVVAINSLGDTVDIHGYGTRDGLAEISMENEWPEPFVVPSAQADAFLDRNPFSMDAQDVETGDLFVDAAFDLADLDPTHHSPTEAPTGSVVSADHSDWGDFHAQRLRADAARWTNLFFDADSDDESLDGGTGGSAYADACSSARFAGGMCSEVSEAFVSWMGERLPGVRCETADFDSDGCDYIPDGSPHTVALIHDDAAGSLVVDLTHRQFDDGADLPHVVPLAEWEQQWKRVQY